MQRAPFDVGDSLKADFAAALDGTGHPCLISLVGVSTAFDLAAHKRLIYLNNAEKSRASERIVAHSFPNPMAQVPSRAIRSKAKGTLHLIGRNSLLGFEHQVDGDKPLPQRQVGIVHDGLGGHAELVAASHTVPLWPRTKPADVLAPAVRASNLAFRPPQVFEEGPALVVGLKPIHQVNQIERGCVSHA